MIKDTLTMIIAMIMVTVGSIMLGFLYGIPLWAFAAILSAVSGIQTLSYLQASFILSIVVLVRSMPKTTFNFNDNNNVKNK